MNQDRHSEPMVSFGFSIFSMQYIFTQTTLKFCHDNTIATLQGKYPEKKKIEVSSWQPIQNGSGDTLLHKTLKKHLLALIRVFSDVSMHRLLER